MKGQLIIRKYGFLLLLALLFCISHIEFVNSKLNPTANIMNKLKKRFEESKNRYYQDLFAKTENMLKKFKQKPVPNELQSYKNSIKKKIMQSNPAFSDNEQNSFHTGISFLSLKQAIPSGQGPEYFFVNSQYERSIDRLPLSGEGKEPWSASYWPIRNGAISVRYNKNYSMNTIGIWDFSRNSWKSQYTLSQSIYKYSQPSEWNSIAASQRQAYVDYIYSPAEKYDILVGDSNFGLTAYLKRYSSQFSQNGDCPGWYGICHGWAPASFRYPKALKSVTLTAADNLTRVTFLPNDIYALTSLFWANASFTTRFLGAICPYSDSSQIKSDPYTGLYLDPQCSAINPGAFVLAMGNELGIKKLNAILDPSSDGEIWNQPIKSYTMRFFNVLTKTFAASVAEAKQPVNRVKASTDSFMRFISNRVSYNTVSIVGVFMTYTYSVETEPVHNNQPNQFYSKTDQTIASLELDAYNNIIGGEWLTNKHPNFMWKPDEASTPAGKYDSVSPSFTGSTYSLQQLSTYAKASSQYGQPLKTVVDYIVNLASTN